jgi:hypothetical protein
VSSVQSVFTECLIKDECLKRGQGQKSGTGVTSKWHSQNLFSDELHPPREKVLKEQMVEPLKRQRGL